MPSLWDFVSSLSIRDGRDFLAFFVFLLGFANWFRPRKPYALTWTEMLDESLFERKGWLTSDLKVDFAGIEIINPRVVMIKIHNLGQHPIRPNDYAEPLRIVFSADAKVVYAHGVSKSVDVQDICDLETNTLRLAPKLLNPDDYFVLRILVDSRARTHPAVNGRLAGVVRINETGIKVRDRLDYLVLTFLTTGFFLVLAYSFPLIVDSHGPFAGAIGGMLGGFFSYIYEFARTFRYVGENAKIAQQFSGAIDAFWFTSRIPRV